MTAEQPTDADPTSCPYHNLPSGEQVWITLGGGIKLPYSAEWACSEWHLAVHLAPVYERAQVVLDVALDRVLS